MSKKKSKLTELTRLSEQIAAEAGSCYLCFPEKCGHAFIHSVYQSINVFHIPVDKIADEFEVAPSTVMGWADGSILPHFKIQYLVIKYLEELQDTSGD